MVSTVKNINTFTDYGAEAQDIERRRKMAELLQQQALQPIEQTTAGGYVTPISWTQGLAKALQGYAGMKGQEAATQQAKDLAGRRNQAMAETLGAMPTARQEQGPTIDDMPGQLVMPGQTRTVEPGAQDYAKWMSSLAQIGPEATQVGSSMIGYQQKKEENAANRDAKTLDRLMALDAAAQNAALSREERAARAQEAADLRRELQTSQQQFMANQNRQAAADRAALHSATQSAGKVPPGYRMLPDGNMQAIPGGPADVKAQKQAEQVDSGRGTVSSIVTQLRDSYDQLDKAGGITNPEAGGLSNLGAGVSSSAIGQAAGRLFGTQNQSLRNNIAQTRPLLLNAIKQATGMSAKQMDSNAELKMYLSAATDPTLDIKANRQALDMLDKLYGLSGHQTQPAGATGGWSIKPVQ